MKKRILIIDDKYEFRKLLKIILKDMFSIETAENGLQAFSILQGGYLPDLILCDMMMPELGGENFLKNMKRSGVFSKIPFIILSSIDNSTTRVKMLNEGANDYVVKPFNPEELIARINKSLLLPQHEFTRKFL